MDAYRLANRPSAPTDEAPDLRLQRRHQPPALVLPPLRLDHLQRAPLLVVEPRQGGGVGHLNNEA